MNRTRILTAAALTLAAAGWGGLLFAGPINPPAGPVAPTYKTLTEVEPRIAINAANTPGDADSLFKITQPGSYYLTGNITGVVGKHGIEIVASGVTLDLMGFDLAGVPAMGAFDGVSATTFSLSNIAVVNGSIRNWGGDGVDLLTFGPINSRVEGVAARGNTSFGIGAFYSNTATNCSAYLNGGAGFIVDNGGTVSNCTAYQNGGDGLNVGSGCTVSRCAAYVNGGNGISTSNGCLVIDCSALDNTLDGIRCFAQSIISGNTCSNNGNGGFGAGIHVTSTNNRIEGNNCSLADRGILVDAPGNIIIRNTCSANTASWSVVAGNVILVVNGVGAPAVFGTAGGAAPGSTDPNANFSY